MSASDDQKAQMLQLAQAAAASCSETQDGSVSEQVSALHSAASAALPDIYAVLDSTPAEDAANVQTELLTESDLTGAFTQDGAADAVRGLVYGLSLIHIFPASPRGSPCKSAPVPTTAMIFPQTCRPPTEPPRPASPAPSPW